MARTNPHHDWDDTYQGGRRSSGAEWESLRNELVALLDQVEDQVAGVQAPKVRARPTASPQPAQPEQDKRHTMALRTVREAVDRLADRNDTDAPARRASIADAASQIRARQGQGSTPAPAAAQTEAPKSAPVSSAVELAGFAQAVASLGQRIEHFETKLSAKVDSLGNNDAISEQIGQLGEVIELLANAVGESGQVKRIEAQISNLAEMMGTGTESAQQATAARIAELTATIERLTELQVQSAGRDAQLAAEASERQMQAFEHIENSVRSIYDRIDTLEASRPTQSEDIERISHDMAALTAAMRDKDEPTTLLAKIDALNERIGALEPDARGDADTLRESVETLRGVLVEALEPRFAALESRIEDMSARAPEAGTSALEIQLRKIAQRVEETSAQLTSLAALHETAPAKETETDLSALADMIVERTRADAAVPGVPSQIEKSDLEALEDRLAKLFATEGTVTSEPNGQLTGVKDSIAQVDNRLVRLESMLNDATRANAARVEHTAAQDEMPAPRAEHKGRSKPSDEMPTDPVSGETRRVLGQGPAHVASAIAASEPEQDLAPAPEPTFALDPETIEKPAKPQSSFSADLESPFGGKFRDVPVDGDTEAAPSVSRSSFIEAARRAARQHAVEEPAESKSLIGRAMARFQRSNSPDDAQEQPQGDDIAPSSAKPSRAASTPAPTHDVIDTSTEGRHTLSTDDNAEFEHEEKQPGFITRNRRALLLGTALAVVVILAVPLVINRLAAPSTPTAQVAAPTAPEPAPAEDAVETPPVLETPALQAAPETTSDAGSSAQPDAMMSAVRLIDQTPSLSAARVDSASLAGPDRIDTIQTASIGPNPDRYIDRSMALDVEPAPVMANLPPITAPAGIEPEALRLAAEGGNARAQFEIGALLTEGQVVAQDLEMAAAWYERSAAQGFAPAQYRLGSLYESGQGVDRDLEQARVWYQRAAESGNRMSMHNLASLHAGGELEQQDFSAAARWFEDAAARGLTDSQFNLGMLYARGLGIAQDFEQSYVWFSLAARAGDEDAAQARDDVARSLDADAIQRLNDTLSGWAPADIDMAANFAPIGTWDDNFDPGPAITNSEVVLRVQMLLAKLGYEVGTPDGIAGPMTREAIAAFERETGMSESSAVNPRLLAVLGSQPV